MKKIKHNNHPKNILILTIIVLIVIVGTIFACIIKKSAWDGKQRINIVLVGSKNILISYSPSQQELTQIVFPNQLLLNVPHGYGEYAVQAIPRLAEIENRNNLFAETIQENFGLPVDGWIKNLNTGDTANFLLEAIKRKGTTNLSFLDLLRLLKAVEAVKINHSNTIDLLSANAIQEVKLPDQSVTYGIVTAKTDLIIQRYFRIDALRQENFTVQIFNGTSAPGLAQKAGRILFNIGINVIDINNTKDGWGRCEVKSRKAIKNSQTIINIVKIFDCGWVDFEDEQRADIMLTIGKNYWDKLNNK